MISSSPIGWCGAVIVPVTRLRVSNRPGSQQVFGAQMMPSVGRDCHPRMHGPRAAFGRSGDAERHPRYSRSPMACIRLVVAVLPAKIVFERAFGRDWEPETITFRDLQVRE